MFSQIKLVVKAAAVTAIMAASLNSTAASGWNKVNEAIPFKSAPSQIVTPEELARAVGINTNVASSTQTQQLNWATESLNALGFARISTSNDVISTVWYANKPTRGPYKGHTGLVLKQCDRAYKPTCFSRSI